MSGSLLLLSPVKEKGLDRAAVEDRENSLTQLCLNLKVHLQKNDIMTEPTSDELIKQV